MADQLYLSLWFPNFRFAALPEALVGVLRQFALISGDKRVAAASAYPLGFSESPTYQRLYVHDERAEETPGSLIEAAVAEATEQLHEDMAYEFEMKWQLWAPVVEGAPRNLDAPGGGEFDSDEELDRSEEFDRGALLDPTWKQQPATVRILGFGPQFDDASFDQNGHIRVDFGLDTPWLLEDAELDETATRYIQKNIEMLLAFTLSVEKHCGISSRLLWTESGEPLAQKLVERLQRVN
jgi:hypothetical protein